MDERQIMIANVIFDLSEVLLPGMIGVEDRLSARTGVPKDRITQALGSYPHYRVGNILDDLLKGRVSYEEYRHRFLQSTGLPETCSALFDEECLRMFASPYDYTEELLANVAARCEILLLSDHCETWVTWIAQRHSFLSRFKDVIWSYEIRATKRELLPFETILTRHNLDPESCLFVDDHAENIEMARQTGMHTIHFTGPECVPEIYAAIGIADRGSGPKGD